MTTTTTTGGVATIRGYYVAKPPTPPPTIRKPTRCLGRVGRRQCRCMARDLYCHRHKAQETAYFMRMNKPWTIAQVVETLAEKAILNWDLEDAEYDADKGTLTVKDWCGATFVLTVTQHVKAPPFKARLAAALAEAA